VAFAVGEGFQGGDVGDLQVRPAKTRASPSPVPGWMSVASFTATGAPLRLM
jgi:hypothetical protein